MYKHIFVAGTFDGLHKGHQAVLTAAFAQGEKVTVGITPDEYVRKFKRQFVDPAKQVKPFVQRKTAVETWLKEQRLFNRSSIITIKDQYEPAASDPDIDALIITRQNSVHGEFINKMRERRGLEKLTLLEVPIVKAQDGKPISSSRMRIGEIDGAGRLVMPEALRSTLGKPLGTLLSGLAIPNSLASHKGDTIIAVGDVTVATIIDSGVIPSLSIIDEKVERKDYQQAKNKLSDLVGYQKKIVSGPGFISKEAIVAIGEWAETLQKNSKLSFEDKAKLLKVIIVDGEEDLLVLPAVILAPLGSVVYYGQPGQGMVEVVVTNQKKQEAGEMLRKFIGSDA